MNSYREREKGSSSGSDDDDDDSFNALKAMKSNKKVPVQASSAVMDLDLNTEPPTINTIQKRKINNIWSSVVQEQTINDNLGQFNMDNLDDRLGFDRGCEKYDFTRKVKDTRPDDTESDDEINLDYGVSDIENEFDELEGAPAKEVVKKKQAKVTFKEKLEDAEKIAREVAIRLQEPKVDLIVRCVQVLGRKKVFDLLHMTEDIEENGGMLIVNGSRRRTAGGVFLFNMRKDHCVGSKEKNYIFAEDKAKTNNIRKSRMKLLKKREKKFSRVIDTAVKMDMEASDPETNVPAVENKQDSDPPGENGTSVNIPEDVELEEGEII